MSLKNLQKKILISFLLGGMVVLLLSLFSDFRAVREDFSRFQWAALPAILGFTLLNYLLRWVKWHYYLRRLSLDTNVSYGDSGLIFTAGMVMSVTPGKIGEVFKSFLLRRVNDTSISRSAPVVLVERLTDGLAMLLLMAIGLTLYPPARPFFFVLLGVSLAGILVVQHRPLCMRILHWTTRLPLGRKAAPKLTHVYESTIELMGWRVLLISTLLSFVSWGFECVAFYYVLTGLGVPGTSLLLLQATFIFAASTLFGLVSFLPGGLGASEVSSTGLLIAMVGVTASTATTATIIIRFCTLWFGVGLGIIALLWFLQRYRMVNTVDAEQAAVS